MSSIVPTDRVGDGMRSGPASFSAPMRRLLLVLCLLLGGCSRPPVVPLHPRLAAIDAGGRFGVSVLHVETGERVAVEGGRRFPMQSVFKLPLAIAVLRRVDAGTDTLDANVVFGRGDLRASASDLAERYPDGGAVPLREALRVVLQSSDNTAADLLLARIGGPSAVMSAVGGGGANEHRFAIDVSRGEGALILESHGLVYTPEAAQRDVTERLIAAVSPSARHKASADVALDARDTSTPDAMVDLLAALQRGELLSTASTRWLLGTLAGVRTGEHRLRAGLPRDVVLAHKTGTSSSFENVRDALADVGLVTLPDGTHLAIAAFVAHAEQGDAKAEAAIAEAARMAWSAWSRSEGRR